jgi:hypothetical protein
LQFYPWGGLIAVHIIYFSEWLLVFRAQYAPPAEYKDYARLIRLQQECRGIFHDVFTHSVMVRVVPGYAGAAQDAIGMDGRRGAEFGIREVEQRAGELRLKKCGEWPRL